METNKNMGKTAENLRIRVIVRTSVIGIFANVMLASFKAVIGLLTNSIAIVLDAVNNVSDAASSIITIFGAKLAGKEPDKKHPFGYGRIEYLSSMLIAMLVLYAGVTSFTESVKKIIEPQTPAYSTVALVIVAVAVLVKILLGTYVKGVGKKMNSDSLINSGTDAMLDSVISASTLAAAALFLMTGISLEAWLGAVISVVIIKSGVEMLKETISHLLGEAGDVQLMKRVKEVVRSFPEVQGAYDLILHDYGPDQYQGSLHIEIADTYTMNDLDRLIRRITEKVYLDTQVILTAVGVYSVNTKDEEVIRIREQVGKFVLAQENVLQMHGFYLDREQKLLRLDVVVSFDEKDRTGLKERITTEIHEKFPEYQMMINLDPDFS